MSSFIAGIFFTSGMTIPAATTMLVALSRTQTIYLVAFFGALGALIGDFLIFRFIKDRIALYILEIVKHIRFKLPSLPLPKWAIKILLPIGGVLILASPLPDEIGLLLMGLTKTKSVYLFPLIFIVKFLGIMAIGTLSRAF